LPITIFPNIFSFFFASVSSFRGVTLQPTL
jgi:hypothetical protein